MTTPRPPSVQFDIVSQSEALVTDRVFRIGLIGSDTGGTAAATPPTRGTLYGPFSTLAELAVYTGSTSPLKRAADAIFGHGINPVVYLISIDTTAATWSTANTGGRAQAISALQSLEEINPPLDFLYPVDLTNAGEGVTTAAVTSALEAAVAASCERIKAIGIIDSPDVDLTAHVTWLGGQTSPLGPRIRTVFNRVRVANSGARGVAGGSYYLGAALRQAAQYGRQAGINHLPVVGATLLVNTVRSSPLPGVSTDGRTLVEAYGAGLITGDTGTEILGDTFRTTDAGDPLRYWGPRLVIDTAEHVGLRTLAQYTGDDTVGNTPSRRRFVARKVSEAIESLVGSGEIANVTARPHPTRNTAAAIAARHMYIQSFITLILATNQITVELDLGV